MGSSIRQHLTAMTIARSLRETADDVQQTRERLASGQRINNVSDDAAGLAVATGIRADSKVARVAIQNVNDGISAATLAADAWSEITAVLQTMSAVAGIAAASQHTTAQQTALNNELFKLASEVERIATTTKYNGITLLSGGTNLTLAVQFASYSGSQIQFNALGGQLQELGLASAGTSNLNFQLTGATPDQAQRNAQTALAAVEQAITEATSRRGLVGASEDRLHTAVRTLTSAVENFSVAEGRIRDIDKAAETAKLAAAQIREDHATALLAQANQDPSLVATLLASDDVQGSAGGNNDSSKNSVLGGSPADKNAGKPLGKGLSIDDSDTFGLLGGEVSIQINLDLLLGTPGADTSASARRTTVAYGRASGIGDIAADIGLKRDE